MSIEPTQQQTAFLDAICTTNDNIMLRARAGCGKTVAILMGVDAIVGAFPGKEIIVCAFNKAIADEVKEKLKERGHTDFRTVAAQTLHGMGFGLVKWVYKGVKLDDKKVAQLVNELNHPLAKELFGQIVQLVKLAKQEGFGFFDDRQIGDIGAWYRMGEHYGINGFDDTSMMDSAVEFAQQVYRASLSLTSVVDFDDMILFPLVKNLRVGFPKDFLFVDEAQDLSRSRQALAKKFVKPHTGRMIIVGDDRQAIYGFSGADADALTNLTKELRAVTMPLSVTWRCPKAVVQLAQKLVPDIEAAPTAPEGVVGDLAQLPDNLGPETAVLCRNTAPLIDLAYALIRGGTPVKVEGRDIGAGLKLMVNRWKVKTIDAFLNRLSTYEQREIQKAMAKGKEEMVERIEDKCETLRVIARECLLQGRQSVSDMVAFIDALFADGETNCTILATYHRSKGREWDRVILLNHSKLCPSPYARQEWQVEQENNLAYVAYTRSKSELWFYVTGA